MQKFNQYNIYVESDNPENNSAEFIVNPLERGFGITLGNALRRTILSSVPGASMFAIKIDGATHEFAAIPGVSDDATSLILNLKKLVIKIDQETYEDEEVVTLYINRTRPGQITGADIECPAGVEVINKDLFLTTLSQDSKFGLEIKANTGRGYKTFHENKELVKSLGWIATDSNYSPVKKVGYDVQEVKSSKSGTTDKLRMSIQTNGAMTPQEVVSTASKILTDHLRELVNISESAEHLQVMAEKVVDSSKTLLSMPIEELDLTVRSYNCLKRAGVQTVQELTERTENELAKIRNLGKKSFNEILDKLAERGLQLKDEY